MKLLIIDEVLDPKTDTDKQARQFLVNLLDRLCVEKNIRPEIEYRTIAIWRRDQPPGAILILGTPQTKVIIDPRANVRNDRTHIFRWGSKAPMKCTYHPSQVLKDKRLAPYFMHDVEAVLDLLVEEEECT